MIIKNNDHNVHQPASNQNHYQFTNHHQQGELFSPDREDAEETAEPSEAKLSRLSWNMLRKIIIKIIIITILRICRSLNAKLKLLKEALEQLRFSPLNTKLREHLQCQRDMKRYF